MLSLSAIQSATKDRQPCIVSGACGRMALVSATNLLAEWGRIDRAFGTGLGIYFEGSSPAFAVALRSVIPAGPTRTRRSCSPWSGHCSHSLWVILATVLAIADANAQDAEPRLYTNAPVGLNFLILGHLYSEGKIAFDPSSSITDAEFHSNTEALAYVRTLHIGGNSAKFDVILPYSSFSASGLVAGRPREREMSGLGDPRFGKVGNQGVRHAICEILLSRLAGHVGEGKHCNRRLVRQGHNHLRHRGHFDRWHRIAFKKLPKGGCSPC